VVSRPNRPFGHERQGRPSRPTRPCPSFPFLPHRAGSAAASFRAAAPWVPRRPSPMPWSDPNGCPLLNSVTYLYSVINPPPPLFTACNRRLHGRPLKPSPVPPPPSVPYKRRRPSPDPHRTHPHSPPLLSELELHHLRAPLPPSICHRCPAITPPNEPGCAPRQLHRPPLSTPDPRRRASELGSGRRPSSGEHAASLQ
jgi:hypothetical protein